MATSDDEMEDLPESVTNYYFVDDAEEPISFSVLPINWNTSEAVQGSGKQIYVRGNADAGLDKIFKPVRAWKFDISGVKPEISVLSKDNNWIKLQKPRQSFEEYIRTVLITVNFLHLVKRNPDFPGNRIWKKLSEIFGLYDVIPSSKDLRSHRVLIEQAVKQDESLKKSKYLLTVLERNQQKRHQAEEDDLVKGKGEFVVNDDELSDEFEEDSGDGVDGSGGEDGSADEEDDDEEPFDSVCSICDEGGPLLCCDGNCLRSFHATVKAGKPSQCSSLGFTEAEVKAMPYFKCQNCQYKLHQCYACGQLGSSDKQTGAKVFQCVNATCGFFYHPHCVAKRLIRNNEDSCKALAEKIQAGESFTCPLHTCIVCKQAEDKTDPDLQMAVCRRCPKAYHKKCLPKEISFGEDEDEDEDMVQRAWEGLLVDRILIYCLKHEIDDDLGTPARNHIKFPRDVKEKESSARVLKESKIAPKNKPSSLKRSQAPLVLESKKKNIEDSDPDKKNDRRVPKLQTKVPLEKKSGLTKIGGTSGAEERKCLQQLDVTKPSQIEKHDESESAGTNKAAVKKFVPQLDSDSERRILDLMKEASSIITLDDIIGKHEKLIPSRAYKQKMDPCKNITEGKVQNLCVAISDVLKKIDRGSSFEEAKGACGPSDLNQLVKWKSKLRVYLAPFLYGMRYTSFGRHFTKIDRLKEIADTLHWYVNDDDTIVDFCCGSNDFSLLMKENLESRGKKCNYKNYDLFPPKNDFCFETRDWMTVQPSELPTGSKLIMGLNPPFGVRACKANQFIDKALQFKPKLIILIVPPETERLDKKKKSPYDLVWEYKDKLSGKSFYLPGSVDTNDKQMEDWNVVTPVLYLWSRPDWTTKHMEIAKKHNHLLDEQRQKHNTSRLSRDLSFKDHGQSSIEMKTDDASPQTQLPEGPEEKAVGGNEILEKQSAHKDHSIGKQANAAPAKGKKKKNSKKKRRNEGIHIEDFKRRRFSPGNPQTEVSYRSPHNSRDGRETGNLRHHVGSPNFEPSPYAERRFSVENRPPRYHKSPSNGDLIHDQHLPGATGYGTANYDSPYYNDGTVNIHPSEQKIWPMDQGPVADYGPHRNPVDSRMGYMRPDLHNYGFNHSYSTVEQPYETEAYAIETSGYDRRVNHNPMSAMDKYKLRLDGPSSVRPGVGGYIPDVPHPPGVVFYDHHQAQAQRQVYPGGPMSFAPGPPNHYYHHHHHTSSGGWIDD